MIRGFTISFLFRKFHGFYYETQQVRVKQTRLTVARRRREAMLKLEIIKQCSKSCHLFELFVLNNKILQCF